MLRQLENDEAKVVILNAFRFLPGRLGEVLNMRYGIETGQPMTLREIADHFGITPERIRQLENRALRQMQQQHSYLESHLPCTKS
jgi:RNA polymerase sigma factor (sigma-70 family)